MTAVLASSFAGQVTAHLYADFPAYARGGIPLKDKWDAFYRDGDDAQVSFNVGHACAHTPNDLLTDIVTSQVTVVFPGGPNTVIVENLPSSFVFPKLDPPYQELGPALEWALPSYLKPEPVPGLDHAYPFYAETQPTYFTTPRAAVWSGHGLPDMNEGHVKFDVSLPTIPKDSCVREVDIFFAAAQFCPKSTSTYNEYAMAWLLGPTKKWPRHLLGDKEYQWAPYLRMMRDLNVKPLPDKCGGNGHRISIYPGKTDIDQYLKPVVVNQRGIARQIQVEQWIKQNK